MWVVSRLDGDPGNNLHLHERAVFYYSIVALLFGTQFLAAGFLAELFTAFYRRDFVPYSICERAGAIVSAEPSAVLPADDPIGSPPEFPAGSDCISSPPDA